MERLTEMVGDHEKRLNDLEVDRLKQNHQIEVLGMKVDGMGAQFTEMKATVKEDGVKTRESIEKSQEKREKSDEKMNDWIRSQFDNLKASEEAAATRDFETKRTKLQIARDVMLALVAGTVGIQELIQWIGKHF